METDDCVVGCRARIEANRRAYPAGAVTDVDEATNARMQSASAQALPRTGVAVAALCAAGWGVALVAYCRHAIALSPDSMNNYAHVWWIARGLWHQSTIPWSMPVIGHGAALTFPYGFANWILAAVVWPLGGDWATTAVTIAGCALCIVATFCAFPELRRGWWMAAVLVEAPIVQALLFGQQTFVWSAAGLLFGIAAWRRDRRLLAAVVVGVAQANHAAVALPIGVVLVALWLPFAADRRALLKWYLVSVAIALPAALVVLASPAYSDSSPRDRLVNFFSTIGPRILVLVLPVVFVLMARRARPWLAPAAFVLSIGVNLALFAPLSVRLGFRTFTRTPNTAAVVEFADSTAFRPGAMLRVLRGSDSKLGRYVLLRAGAHLDSEFFPESEAIRSFRSPSEYVDLLCRRRIDQVIVFPSYDATRRTNEHAVLERLSTNPAARVVVRRSVRGPNYDVYDIARPGC